MSMWTYIRGVVTVEPMGRTQHEKTYILNTVLDHLPRVTGSEGDMEIHVVKKDGHNSSQSCDEFMCNTVNLESFYGGKSRDGWLNVQDVYFILVDGSLRDCHFEDTYKDFVKWLCRLAKRVLVTKVLVSIGDYNKSAVINESYGEFDKMFEEPSWCRNKKDGDSVNWCEYLMWDKGVDTMLPMIN